MTSLLLAASLLVPPARAQAPRGGVLSNLSCLDTLIAVGEGRLAGVFSFIDEKDTPKAFADLALHDKEILKKFVAKLEKDDKEAGGLSQWDHDALAAAQSILASPVGGAVARPSGKTLARMTELERAPTLTLEQLTSRRKR